MVAPLPRSVIRRRKLILRKYGGGGGGGGGGGEERKNKSDHGRDHPETLAMQAMPLYEFIWLAIHQQQQELHKIVSDRDACFTYQRKERPHGDEVDTTNAV